MRGPILTWSIVALLTFGCASSPKGATPEAAKAQRALAELDERIALIAAIDAELDPEMRSWRGRPVPLSEFEDKRERLHEWRHKLLKVKPVLEASLAAHLADPGDEKARRHLDEQADWVLRLDPLFRRQIE